MYFFTIIAIVSIFAILDKEALLSTDLDARLFEGKVLICRDEANFKGVVRWAEVSKRAFSYYKDHLSQMKEGAKSLGSILLSEVIKIVKSEKSRQGYWSFEIITKRCKGTMHVRRNTIQQLSYQENDENTDAGYEKDISMTQITSPSIKQKGLKMIGTAKEQRHIFALESAEERDKWVTILEWLVKLHQSSCQHLLLYINLFRTYRKQYNPAHKSQIPHRNQIIMKRTATKVNKLNDNTAEQLCSWQVLPDLRTAVKELIDNSIDAHCTSLIIEFHNFGLDGFEVSDDGAGIDPEDFSNIAKKGTTSKISAFEDIYNAQTLGFRGEALAALRTLGDLTISSKRESDPMGTEVRYDRSGNILCRSEKNRITGTSVKITDLFKSVPVRYNEFRRTHKTQYRAALDLIQEYALSHYKLKFSVSNHHPAKGKQSVFLKGAAENLDQNVELVLGKHVSSQFLPLNFKIAPASVEIKGYVKKTVASGSLKTGKGKPMLHMFINKRPVHMPKSFTAVISEIYKKYQQDTAPGTVLFLETNQGTGGSKIDVNISPNKMDVIIEGEKDLARQIRDQLDIFLNKVVPTKMEEVCQKQLSFKPLPQQQQQKPPTVATSPSTTSPAPSRSIPDPKPLSPSSARPLGMNRHELPRTRHEFSSTTFPVRLSQEKDEDEEEEAGFRVFEFKPKTTDPPAASPETKVYPFHGSEEDVKDHEVPKYSVREFEFAKPADTGVTQVSLRPDFNIGSMLDSIKDPTPFVPKIIVINMPGNQITDSPTLTKHSTALDSTKAIAEQCESNINMKGTELATQLNKLEFAKLEVVGQFNMGFIICKYRSELYIVDQHAADEKYNYERLARTTILQSQPLLKPLEVKLTSAELLSAQQNPNVFNENGFKVVVEERIDESSGQLQGVAIIKAMPYSENTSFTLEDFYELLGLMTAHEGVFEEKPESNSNEESKPALLRRAGMRPSKIKKMLASRACRRSVMVGNALNHEEMANIVHRLAGLDCPWTCPHGRPTIRLLMKLSQYLQN
eukprot:TRINITY_DN120354_c2_g1_i1.p1 TRINITY_DN120354_c2_g1~~TRINITY_DN120354_c2_g1_i1.p1  ORF type:complete len:1020 (+),score=78.55 TRINITY_DN120354_c2_g1_i1:605-3664(+)